MGLDVAYSIEADDYIDPDRAYDLYWSGVITDQHKFLCPGTNCTAQVTCANLSVELQNMRVVPHYRVYGKNHSAECEVFNMKPLGLNYENSEKSKERVTVDQSIVDQFILQRPSTYYDERIPPKESGKARQKTLTIDKRKAEARLREIGNVSKIYSVRSVVSRFIRYKKDGSLEQRRINIQGKDVPYRSVFKCVWEQDLSALPEHPIIYYGWAYVNRLKSNHGYQIKFKKQLQLGNEHLTTTVMIADSLIDGYKIKKLVSTRLEKIVKEENPTAFVFIYSRPVKKSSGEKIYANFGITNLDMIDINYECPLPSSYDK